VWDAEAAKKLLRLCSAKKNAMCSVSDAILHLQDVKVVASMIRAGLVIFNPRDGKIRIPVEDVKGVDELLKQIE
jgi:hypothetical protein